MFLFFFAYALFVGKIAFCRTLQNIVQSTQPFLNHPSLRDLSKTKWGQNAIARLQEASKDSIVVTVSFNSGSEIEQNEITVAEEFPTLIVAARVLHGYLPLSLVGPGFRYLKS